VLATESVFFKILHRVSEKKQAKLFLL